MARQTLVITFLAALVTFSAFGAAIMAFLVGGGLDSVADFWIKRGEQEAAKRGRQVSTQREADQRKKTVRGVSLLAIAVIQIISGIGMTACGLWLLVMAQHWTWGSFTTALYLLGVSTFLADTGLITLLMVAAVVLLTVLQPRFSTKPEAAGAGGDGSGMPGYGARHDGHEDAVDLDAMLARFAEHWAPKKIAQVNDYDVRIVKVQGEFTWHRHADTDEFFLVLDGQLTIQLPDRNVVLGPRQLFVVPRGVEHCPRADTETAMLLFEPGSVVNTGDAGGELTAEVEELADPGRDGKSDPSANEDAHP